MYTLSHEPETVGCGQCISAGYVYHYATDNEAMFNEDVDIASGDDYPATAEIDGVTKDVNYCADILSLDNDLLKSNQFDSPYSALANCPVKEDVCGSTLYTSIEDVGESAEFSVTDMTGMDMCGYMVDTGCGLPKITITEATGAFDYESNEVMLYFVEGTGDFEDHLETDINYSDVDRLAYATDAGNFFPVH